MQSRSFPYSIETWQTLPLLPLTFDISLLCRPTSQQPTAGVAYTHPTTVASYTVHQAPVAAHTVAAAYAPSAATVAVARPAPVSVATAAAYGGYQPTHTAADYGYAQRQPEVPPPPPPVTSQNYQVRHHFFFFQNCYTDYNCFVILNLGGGADNNEWEARGQNNE